MEKKDNVEKEVSEKPEEKKSAAYYEKRPEFGNRGPSKILADSTIKKENVSGKGKEGFA